MAVVTKGTTFATGNQVTAANLNALVDSATFATGAVDNSTTQLSGGAIIVKDGGITPSKLSTGGPSWDSNGNTVIGGTTTNDSAATGDVGEYVSSSVAVGSAISLTDLTAANVTSISLTAGDWDVSGYVLFSSLATGAYFASASVSSTSATVGDYPSVQYTMSDALSIRQAGMAIVPTRFSIASTTTIYLVARAGLGSTGVASGIIRARRVR